MPSAVSLEPATVVADPGRHGYRSLSVELNLPRDIQSEPQGKDHRWEYKHITELDLTLSAEGKVLSTVTFLKHDRLSARFTHLKFGVPYVLSLVAKGNHDGDSEEPVQVLNSQTLSTGSILFSGSNDVENSPSIRLPLVLDSDHESEHHADDRHHVSLALTGIIC